VAVDQPIHNPGKACGMPFLRTATLTQYEATAVAAGPAFTGTECSSYCSPSESPPRRRREDCRLTTHALRSLGCTMDGVCPQQKGTHGAQQLRQRPIGANSGQRYYAAQTPFVTACCR